MQSILCATYGTWEEPGWPASATMRCWGASQGLEEEPAALVVVEQLEMRRVQTGCLLLEAAEGRMEKARLVPEEELEPDFEAVGSGPPG